MFLTCEGWQSNGVPLWRMRGDGSWRRVLPGLLDGHACVDPTLLRWEGRWWLFCTLRGDEPDRKLHLPF